MHITYLRMCIQFESIHLISKLCDKQIKLCAQKLFTDLFQTNVNIPNMQNCAETVIFISKIQLQYKHVA